MNGIEFLQAHEHYGQGRGRTLCAETLVMHDDELCDDSDDFCSQLPCGEPSTTASLRHSR